MPLQPDQRSIDASNRRTDLTSRIWPAVLTAMLISIAGCGESRSLSVSGEVSLDGRQTSAELLFERLNEKGKREGQPVSTLAQADGRFETVLPAEAGTPSPVRCRIQIRVPRGPQRMSSAFDYDALPDKVVELRRELTPGDELNLLLTQ